MPWCPKCRFEYVPQLHACPECKVKLVAELPEEPAAEEPAYGEGKGFEPILLCTVLGEIHSELVGNALAEAGIPSRKQERTDPPVGVVYGVAAPMAASYEVWVNQRDLERAREVYQAFEGPDR